MKTISENIVFFLIENKVLNNSKKEVYQYAMEVILLNGSIMLSTLGISLITGMVVHFLFFVLIFCPLRMVAGGYHAKSEGYCFIISNIIFIVTIILKKLSIEFDCILLMVVLAIYAVWEIYQTGPLERKGIYISEKKYNRHKTILRKILLSDLILIVLLYWLQSEYLASVVVSLWMVRMLQHRIEF